jgi:predicted  nucleic acid-binding Zn-ribbon protein
MVSQGDKQQVAVRIPLRQKAELEREAAERGTSRSEYIRNILTDRHRVNELQQRLDIREERINELETQLAERSQIQTKIEDLPDKIRGEMTYQERRQRMLDQASLAQRLRWKLTGVPVDETVDEER